MWQLRELVEEGRRNLTAQGSRLRLVGFSAVLAGSVLAAAIGVERSQLESEVAALAAEGWVTVTFTVDPGPEAQYGIVAASCRKLGEMPGVLRSGAVSRSSPQWVIELGPATPVVVADPGLLSGPGAATSPEGPTAYVGRLLQDRGTATVTVQGIRYRASASPSALSAAGLGNTVVLPGVAVGLTSVCIAVLSPEARVRPLGELTGQLRATAAPIVDGFVIDPPIQHPYERFITRLTRYLPLLAGFFLAALYAVALRSRSSEFGAYLTAGTRRRELVVMSAVELVLLASIHFASTTVGLVVVQSTLGLTTELSWLNGFTSAAALLVGGVASAVIGSRRRVFDLLKDR